MTDIFKEVDEDLRRQQAESLFKKYGAYIVGAVLAVVIAVGGYQAWTWWDLETRTEQSMRYQAALDSLAKGDAAAAAIELGEVQAGGGSYAVLARFNEARLLSETGDKAGAIQIWGQIAEGSDGGEALRGAARILAVLHQLDDGDPANLEAQLQPLLEPGNGYRPIAMEMRALLALRQGDQARARDLYTEVVDDLTAPAALRARAAQMLAALGG